MGRALIRKDFAVRTLDAEPAFAELLAGLGERLAAGAPWLEGSGAEPV